MRRRVAVACLILAGIPFASPSAGACTERLLVLSAFPGEIDKLLTSATVNGTEVVDGRAYYVGTLEGNEVVLALSGIGLVNAESTTRAAISHFTCGDETTIGGVVFSGVAGGPHIGDVTIPEDWTLDGTNAFAADPAMFSTAQEVASGGEVALGQDTPVGDPACVGTDPALVRTVPVEYAPRILVGGHGASSDGFGGRAFPCVPGGGDVFGCEPCRAPSHAAPDAGRFAEDLLPFVDPSFFLGYSSSPPPGEYVAQDMETAAVAAVAAETGIPFIAVRAASDGEGDPLGLPGFPAQFFFYKQLAADNAAMVTLAFLRAWSRR